MIGDLLLRWMSETGTGAVADLRDRAAWLARTADLPLGDFAPGRWLQYASALGHCEIDWDRGQWATAPAALTRLPNADATAVLAGARRQQLMDALDDALDAEGALGVRRTGAHGEEQIPPPETVMVWFDSESQLRSIAHRLGVRYAGCAASGIARRLPAVALGRLAAPPAAGTDLERLTTVSPRKFRPAKEIASRRPDGLYRRKDRGRYTYQTLRDGNWYHCELSSGVFLELRRRGVEALRWRPESGSGRGYVGTFLVEAGVPLAPLHERALVLCSGFAPTYRAADRVLAYNNVPLTIARAVAASLGQRLQPLPPAEGRSHD